jgi:ABC-type antimicrobial peptide transport system permease subunit
MSRVGVLPETFRSWLPVSSGVHEHTDVWFPRGPEDDWLDRGAGAIARLSAEATLDQVRSELAVLATRLQTEHAAVYQNAAGALEFQVRPLREVVAAPAARGLVPLGISVVFVLIIGCVNLATLMLARAKSREREAATRLALGAGRVQVLRQRLAEQLVLGMAGGLLSLVVAWLGRAFLHRFGTGDLPRQSTIALGVDTVAIAGVAGAIAVGRVLAGLLYGVAAIDTATLAVVGLTLAGAAMLSVVHPAWRAVRVDPRITLQAE